MAILWYQHKSHGGSFIHSLKNKLINIALVAIVQAITM
ncbi:hypothetical protein B4158_6106 [Bacillus cereus]|nr:hypothetical protein B4158_6106 [Bacillus cereus]